MPLKLVTGPANAAKAGEVLGGLRARLDDEPVLVVPTFEDVEHNQRELAERGAVFGARVLRFNHLFRLIAQRTGAGGRIASPLQCELVMGEAIRAARLEVMAESSRRPGFVRAAVRFVGELERSMVDPANLTRALRAWAGEGARRAYAEELAGLYRGYRERLDAAGLLDRQLFAWRALDALRQSPESWSGTPVFVYGFDDFTPLELAALGALSGPANADVVVSLPFEPEREAFRATRAIRDRLLALGVEEVQLPALSDYYADESRDALHALERSLFEDGAPAVDPGDAVAMHLAGGRRAEVELCAAEVLKLLRAGTAAGDVAVVMRDPRAYASTVEQVFGAYGIPYSIDRSVPLRQTGLGRGLLALLRCATDDGTADDLLAYLRTPGRLREPIYADRLEVAVRRDGQSTAARARQLWDDEVGPFPLEEIDRLAALTADVPALIAELASRAERLFAGPYFRTAHLLEGAETDDARAFRAVQAALRDLRAVARSGSAGRIDASHVHDTLAALPVRVGEAPQPGRAMVASPLDVRARRFDAVFICGLQEGEFPSGGASEPFLSDADRREIARASGLLLPLREDQLERERYLFYVCASRAERRLVLSARTCGEEGEPEPRSFFLDDVERIFPGLSRRARRRSLSDVAWSPEEAPTDAEWERAVAALQPGKDPVSIGPVSLGAALAALGDRGPVSAGAIERFAGCPVSWLVEDVLRPVALEPDPERMIQGAYAHRVLELTFRRLRERTGDRQVTEQNLPQAEAILLEALEQEAEHYVSSPNRARVRAALRRLEFELLRHLRYEAQSDSAFEPEHLELAFGSGDGEHPAVELADGLRVRGRIDRVDRLGDKVAVRDYKSGRVATFSAASWPAKGRLQAALYMEAAEQLLGVEAVAGLYTPLAGTDRRSRGVVSSEAAEQLGGDFYGADVLERDDLSELREWAREAIVTAAREMGAGQLCSRPDSCAYRGGCSHPSICRIER
jgi:ATP-dependent helicase/DNAse subunit B